MTPNPVGKARTRPQLSTTLVHAIIYVGAALGLAACQPVPGATDTTADPTPSSPPLPTSCADGVQAELAGGMRIDYTGSLASDRDVCLVRWDGHEHRYFLGFWGSGLFQDAPAAEREALRGVLSGSVGTEVTFPLRRGRLWSDATVTHVADTLVDVDGQKRATTELRVRRHERSDAPGTDPESLYWIDRQTGITLRQQVVTPMVNGEQLRTTVWEVRRVVAPSAAASPAPTG
jgi:hypothetical protein